MDSINQIWPKWHTQELLGKGAFGEVYKVKREELGETFYSAVKVIRIPHDTEEIKELMDEGHTSQSIRYYYESIARGLMNEIKVMEVLKSAGNVVNIEEFDVREREDGIGWEAFIRMELLRNLNEYRQGREMSQEEIVKLGSDICEALVCCEKSRVIHRDIKPSNIFVDVYGNFKLGDFGIARQMERTQSTLSQKGTEMYMAPEVRYGESGSSYNVDLYSLGLVMYRLLNGNRMPFEPADKEMISFQEREEALACRLSGEKLPLPAKADPALGRIIVKACEADRTKRYQSAEEMKEDLLLFSSGHGTERGTAERTEAAEAVKAEAETRAGEQEEPTRSRGKAAAQFVEEETVSAFSERGQAQEVPKKSEADQAHAAQEKYPKYPVNGKDVYVTKEVRRDQKYIYVKPEGAQFQRRIELPQEPSAWLMQPILNYPPEITEKIFIQDAAGQQSASRQTRYLPFVNHEKSIVKPDVLLEKLDFLIAGDVLSAQNFDENLYPKRRTIRLTSFSGLITTINLFHDDQDFWIYIKLSTTNLPTAAVNAYIKDNSFLYDGWFFKISAAAGRTLANYQLM